MAQLRFLVLGLSVGLVLSLSQGCGPATAACGPSWCGGCCDATDHCVGGEALDACGSGGAVCDACGAAELCQTGACALDPALNAGDSGTTPTNPLVFTATISPNPPVIGINSMDLTITGANGVPVTGATVTAKAWMPSMPGMGTSTATVTEVGGGSYKVTHVAFSMGGGWQVKLTATADDGLAGNRNFNYVAN